MSINFFKPEDFSLPDPFGKYATEIANAKLREGAKVFCNGHTWTANKDKWSTHQALLICIEPIEQCTHPKEKVEILFLGKKHGYECQCGAEVRPTGFEEIK